MPLEKFDTAGAVLIIGAGGHARACLDVAVAAGYQIIGLIGTQEEVGAVVFGYPVIGTDDDLHRLRRSAHLAVVGIGNLGDTTRRRRVVERATRSGYRFPVVLSPHAYVSPFAEVGEGSVVMHGAVVNAGAKLGRHCIINSLALIEHDVHVGDHSHISTRATLNGNVRIGEGCFIGSGVVVRQGVTIERDCFVNMGTLVTEDVEAGGRVRSNR